MSLSTNDLSEIRDIIESALARQSEEVIKPLQSELEALRNDIKDIYDMIVELQNNQTNGNFTKLSLEQQILDLNSKLVIAARKAGVSLPR